MNAIKAFLASLFSTSKIADTAIDAIRKAGGLDDMTAREKADFLLKYMEVTKGQSLARRAIAISLTAAYLLLIVCWLVAAQIGYYANIDEAINLAGQIKLFLQDVLFAPVNIILSFYFVVNIASKVGSGK